MPQGQIALGPIYTARGIPDFMPKRTDPDAIDPADSEFYRLAGLRVRAIRKLSGYKQTQIAELLEVDQSTWSKWETGKRMPRLTKMAAFAGRAKTSLELIYLGVPVATHPALVRLLRASVPQLLVPEPIDTDHDKGTDLASYRDSIRQEGEDSE